jgi:hypothetical protein
MCVSLDSATKVAKVIETAKCCKVEGCENKGKFNSKCNTFRLTLGMCSKHYTSFLRYNDALYCDRIKNEKKVKKAAKKCKIEGCNGLGSINKKRNNVCFIKGYCNSHYMKFIKYGNPLVRVVSVGENRKENPIYPIYKSIKSRCNNPDNQSFKNYGGRGIEICLEWMGIDGFSNFLKDVGERPTDKHSIDRIDVNGNYCKENCRWVTIHKQAANKRNSNKTVGVSYDKSRNTWNASLVIDKVNVFRKRYTTERAAIVARLFAEIKYFGKPISQL